MLIRVCQQKVSFHFSMLVYDFIRLKDHIFSQQRHIKRVLEVYSKKGWCADNNDIVDNSKQPLHCFFYKSVRAFPTGLSPQHPLSECAKEWKNVKFCQSLYFVSVKNLRYTKYCRLTLRWFTTSKKAVMQWRLSAARHIQALIFCSITGQAHLGTNLHLTHVLFD